MKAIRNFLLKNLFGVYVAFVVVFITYNLFFAEVKWSIGQYIVCLLFIIAGYRKTRERKLAEEQLRKKGLTSGDLLNIEFVKNWDLIRKKGIYRYCMLDDGIITGLIIFIPVSFIGFLIVDIFVGAEIFNVFINMISFSVCCLLTSYITGALLYYIRWRGNEQRFKILLIH